jgi:hypothetical protein
MSIVTRWPHQSGANELVEVPMSFDFTAGPGNPVRTPMFEGGTDQAASIQGNFARAMERGGVGLYNILLKDTVPWFFGDSLKISTPKADTGAPFTCKVCTDQGDYQNGPTPFLRVQVFDSTGVLADPAPGHTIVGSLVFRDRRVGS